jgi:uncharacterized protein YbjT (DUF2867 family)
MAPHILVTGAPGNVGTYVVKALQASGASLRIAAWDVEAARQAFGNAVEIVRFDFLDPATYAQTFAGIDRMFLVRPPQLANVQKEIAPAVHAALEAGVKHIVFLSLQGVEQNRMVPHHKIEKLLLDTGVDFTFLRASFFMQNLSTTHRKEIVESGKIALPVGNAKTSFVDTRDLGAVAARILTENGHENRAYTLTGAEALDYYQVAQIMSEVLEKPIHYTNPSAITFFRQQLAQGGKIGFALVVTGLYTITRFGNAEQMTDNVQQVLGRAPITFRQFVEDHRSIWLT